jgi:hypothetical protein
MLRTLRNIMEAWLRIFIDSAFSAIAVPFTLQYFSITTNKKPVPEIKNDQHIEQSSGNFGQQPTQLSSDSHLNEMDIKEQEIEEWDAVITDQRRPQFRSSENYGRRHSQM